MLYKNTALTNELLEVGHEQDVCSVSRRYLRLTLPTHNSTGRVNNKEIVRLVDVKRDPTKAGSQGIAKFLQ